MSDETQAIRSSISTSTDPKTSLCFTLKYWCLWQSELASGNDCWPNGEVLAFNEGSADVTFIPMLQRRRLSPLARAACAVAWRCREKFGNTPMVFFSNHGESLEYFEMLKDLSAGEGISPSRFSMSVHNAIAGLYSIQSTNMLPYVTLAGGSEGLFAVFLEASGLLLDSPNVLTVCYEQPLPQAYQSYLPTSGTTWALAMVLSPAGEKAQQFSLTRESCFAPPDPNTIEPSLIAAVLNGQRSGYSQQNRSIWRWRLSDV